MEPIFVEREDGRTEQVLLVIPRRLEWVTLDPARIECPACGYPLGALLPDESWDGVCPDCKFDLKEIA
jgi:Zn finger protein HypA/HybF involved in hydrogenase expression